MTKGIHSLYFKISVAFLGVLTLLGVVQVVLSAQAWITYTQDTQQRLFANTAETIASKIEPYTAGNIKIPELETQLAQWLAPPQILDIYLLKESGHILYHSQPFGYPVSEKIDTAPIVRLVQREGLASGAILGENPRKDGPEAIFAAAPLLLNQQPGYVYVVLNNGHLQSVFDVLGRSYFLQVSIAGVLISLFAAAIIGIWSFSILTKPLRALQATVLEFSQGNYKARARVGTKDELRGLADTMNTMASVIEEQIEKLNTQDALRRKLIANISHDIRTPLTSLGGSLEVELERFEKSSREEIRASLEDAYRNFRFMKHLIAELFELSKLEARVAKPQMNPIPVDEIIEDITAGLQSQAAEKQQRLRWELPDELPLARGDFAMISKVIMNLTQNALRYTPEQGEICVAASAVETGIQIQVQDNGMGIPDAEKEHIFSRFYRVKSNARKGDGGTGLGLAIVREIIDLHESSISVESTPGEGSCFRFTLAVAN